MKIYSVVSALHNGANESIPVIYTFLKRLKKKSAQEISASYRRAFRESCANRNSEKHALRKDVKEILLFIRFGRNFVQEVSKKINEYQWISA